MRRGPIFSQKSPGFPLFQQYLLISGNTELVSPPIQGGKRERPQKALTLQKRPVYHSTPVFQLVNFYLMTSQPI